jgi:hypothetical protein
MLISFGLEGYSRQHDIVLLARSGRSRLFSDQRCEGYQLPERNPSCLTPFTRLIPAASSGLNKPASAAS